MYINVNLVVSRGLHILDVAILQLIKQNRNEDMSSFLEPTLSHIRLVSYTDLGLVDFVKPKNKKQSDLTLVRLSKKGTTWLNDFTDTYQVEEEDIIVFDWLKKLYLGIDKEVGSEIKCKNLIAWFRRESGISKNNLIELCKAFTSDENRMEYSKVLQFIFWRGENHFQTTPKLEDSKLWNYYEKHREFFENKFKIEENV